MFRAQVDDDNWLNSKDNHSVSTKRHGIYATPHHNRFTALFPGPAGRAVARRELLDFMVRGKDTHRPSGWRHSIRTKECPPPPSHFFTGRMPLLPLNQQCQSTEGKRRLYCRELTHHQKLIAFVTIPNKEMYAIIYYSHICDISIDKSATCAVTEWLLQR